MKGIATRRMCECIFARDSQTKINHYCRVTMDYKCAWYAPTLAEPDSTTGVSEDQNLLITAGGVQGLGFEPLQGNSVYIPDVWYQHSPILLCCRSVPLD